jgi:uncharacterized membrane protein
MNSKTWTRIVALALFAAPAPTVSMAAQDNAKPDRHHKHHHYQLIDMGTLGGPNSYPPTLWPPPLNINSRGLAIGGADTSIPDPYAPNCFVGDCLVTHTITWRNGVQTDLGALPGVNSSFPAWVNDHGDVVGLSENGVIDPLTGFPEIIGVLWKDGQILDPFTLGGNASYPNAINKRGEVVGAALNTIPDSYAGNLWPPLFPVATQFRAFLWQHGVMRDLGTLGSGNDAGAVFVNERGQVSGLSYTNTTPNPTTGFPTLDTFFWEDGKEGGKMVDIGTLGGTVTIPIAMNNRGQVAGTSNSVGDQTIFAFLWDKKSGIQNLGTLPGGGFSFAQWMNDAGEVVGASESPSTVLAVLWKNGAITNLGAVDGDVCSQANSINSQGQIVGSSFAVMPCNNETHWFLWENGGPSIDLQKLVPPDSGVALTNVAFINDRGEIEGFGNLANGDVRSILLIPCDEGHPGVEGCDYSMVDAASAASVSPAPATQHPVVLIPRSRMPAGIFDRHRFPWQWTLGPRSGPANQKQERSTRTVAGDWLGDHRLGPQYGNNTGLCEEQNGVLNGYCAAFVPKWGYCSAQPSSDCTSGQKATKPGTYNCMGFHQYSADLARKCSFATVTPDFTLSASACKPATVNPGASSTSAVDVTAINGFSGSVALTCTVMPSPALAPACSIKPTSTTPGTPATLTMSTTPPTAGALFSGDGTGLFYAVWLPLIGLVATRVGLGSRQNSKGKIAALVLACVIFTSLVFQAACGGSSSNTNGGGSPGTPTGTYTITVNGTDTSGTLKHSTTTTLKVQ